MASDITFTSLTYTGTPSSDDLRAANKLVREANQQITEQNLVLAAQDPPGTPIPLFATSGVEFKDSVLAILSGFLTEWWGSYAQQAIIDKTRLTTAEDLEISGLINTRLDNGELVADIITDIAT